MIEHKSHTANKMPTKLKRVAVIPARAGSKRIANKNIKPFLGKPLLVYSIEAAKATSLFERIIVSTDSQKIADLAIHSGAEVPCLRPSSLADDYCPITSVLEHTLGTLEAAGQSIDYACCIYATAPLLASADIQRGYMALEKETKYKTALAVTEFPFPVQRALHIENGLGLKMLQPKHKLTRSQDLEKCYHDAGQFFWLRRDQSQVDPNSGYLPVMIDRRRVQDIDTPEDWLFAECMARAFEFTSGEEVAYVSL